MEIVKYNGNNKLITGPNKDKIITDILSIDNKDLLLVSLLEKLCQVVNDKNVLFKKICQYLHKIGIIDDKKAYSDDQQTVRKLYAEYLSQIIRKFGSDEHSNLLQWNSEKTQNGLQVINSQYSNAFIELEKIGDGGFGEVYKAYNYIDSQKYAIKKVPFFDVNDPNNMRAFNEVRCLATLTHENIVRYHTTWLELCDTKMDIMEDTDIDVAIYPVLYIQMELCSGSLKDYIMKRNYSGRKSNMDFEKKCINGIINGLNYIHKNNILHRDLNPNNIFLDENMIPKIGDFGMAVKLETHGSAPQMSSDYGVDLYMPPEYKKDNIYVKKSDIYSAGIIFFELLHVFSTDMERFQIISEIKKGIYPISFVNSFSGYHKIISGMMEENMECRLSIEDLCM